MFKVLKTEGRSRLGEFHTNRGVVKTPAFMNVATSAAIKGGLSTRDLEDVGAQIMLCNTYHLHVRPNDEIVYKMGGLHKFTNWNRPICPLIPFLKQSINLSLTQQPAVMQIWTTSRIRLSITAV